MKIIAITVFFFFIQANTWAESPDNNFDNRISLNFTAAEKSELLREMRQMLASIQGIISGIAEENPDKIITWAKHSGNRMARETPLSIKNKTPQKFKEIGGPTHMMFEELAIRAETDDMQNLTEFTADIIQQCLACHEIYRAN